MTRLLDWICARLPVHTPAEMQREFLRGYRMGVQDARTLDRMRAASSTPGLKADLRPVNGGDE